MKTRALLVAAFAASAAPAALAGLILQTDFETGTPGAPWTNTVQIQQAAPFTRYMGRYSMTDGVSLAFPPPETGGLLPGQYYRYSVTFDLYAIDSWDGAGDGGPELGPDRFMVSANGLMLMNETIATNILPQTMRAPDVGPSNMAYGVGNDAIYRNIELSFDGAATEQIDLRWHGQVMQGMADESWGIDNVRVTYEVVPAPGPIALLALGGALMVRRKRA
ncbi:MAG: hypothetical protein IT437_12910 [Phycisphaerales bacterium]|nr:hypothetical protein [Phycisphaerales bacterium]